MRQARNSKRRDWQRRAAVIQAQPRSANVAGRSSAAPGAAGGARSCLTLKRKISRRACGSGAWRCHAGFGWARPSQDFARTSGASKLRKPATGRGYRSGRPRKRGRRTDNTGRAENGFRRTRVAGLEPRTARRSRLVGSPMRCCTSSCSSGPSRGFSEICGFRGAVMRPLPAVRRLRRRSRTQPFHPQPGLRAINPPCRLGSALPRCSVTPSCARGGEKRRPPSGG